MKPLIPSLVAFLLLIAPAFTQAQKNSGPDNRINIPYGKKLPAPVIHQGDEALQDTYNSKKVDLSNYTTEAKKPIKASLNFHLTKDINNISDSYPGNTLSSLHSSFAVLNNISFFFADDGIHGKELWRSDGTAEGTYMIKDIYPGATSSDISNITAANGFIYFAASTEENGNEPWISDGTMGGTHILKDIRGGTDGSSPEQFVAVNGAVFFAVDGYAINTELWKTDGTDAGTVLVKDLVASEVGYNMDELTTCNNLLYFVASTGSAGFQLFKSDGTDVGTNKVKQIVNYGYYNGPMQLTPSNDKLFFSVDEGTGRKLWVTDGTEIGTTYAPGSGNVFMQSQNMNYNNAKPFKQIGNVLFIAGYTINDGSGLYKYDVSGASNTELVKDLTPLAGGGDYIAPDFMTIVNDQLYFKVISNADGLHDELWLSNGEAAQTQMVKSFVPGENISNFSNFSTKLFFTSNNKAYGTELWSTNGTSEGTVLVKDINKGTGSSSPDYITNNNGKLLFRAADYVSGNELWQSKHRKLFCRWALQKHNGHREWCYI